jgi:hypothetical protein
LGTVANVQLSYSTGGAAFTSPQEIQASVANGTGFGATYNWTVPNAISKTVRVKVKSTSDDGFDISANDFRIRGKLVPVAPVSTDKVPIGQSFTIRWQSYGSMPTVKIHYDVNNGTGGYPNEITLNAPNCTPAVPQTPCDESFVWNNIPDTAAAQAKIRIMDARAGENDVLALTDTFQIVGNFTVVTPNGGQDWRVATQQNIAWTWGGTIPVVKLYYTKEPGDPETVSWTEIDPGVTKDYSTDGHQQNGANNTIQRNYLWTVPDDISSTVRVKIADANNPDVYDVSNSTFKIRGDFTVTSPNGNERWVTAVYTVNEGQTITWTSAGTVPFVKLEYSTDDFQNPANTYVISGSYEFIASDLLGNYGVNSLTGGGLSVGWDQGKLDAIRAKLAADPPEAVSKQEWATALNETIAELMLLEDYQTVNTTPALRDELDAGTKVLLGKVLADGGSMTLLEKLQLNRRILEAVYPAQIKKTLIGAGAPNCIPEDPAIPCNGSFYWVIPDAVQKDLTGKYTDYSLVKVRVSDLNDQEVYDESDDPFKIDYYKVKWIIRDLSTYNLLGELGVTEVKTTDLGFIQWQEAGIGVARLDSIDPPVADGYTRIAPTPAGNWVATWKKTGYGDLPQVVTLSKNNLAQVPPLPLDPSYQLLMETTTVHIYAAEGRFTYDPGAPAKLGDPAAVPPVPDVPAVPDKLDIVAWLARDGSILTGVVNARVYIYEGATIVTGAPVILSMTGDKETGLWNAQIPTPTAAPFNLKSGVTYVAKVQMQIASQVPNNVWYQTPASFEITTPRKLQDVIDQVNYALDKPITEVQKAIQGTLDAQTSTIVALLGFELPNTLKKEMDLQSQAINSTLSAFTSSVQSSLVALEAGAVKSQAAGEQLKKTAEKFSWKTSCSPNPALTGDMVTIQAQGLPGLFPVLSVYNAENKQIIASGPMVESTTNPGNYSFSFRPDPRTFEAGKAYTFIVSEDTTGGLVAGSGFIESTSLTTIAGLVASAPGAEDAAKKALDAIKGIEAAMTKGGDVAGIKDQMAALKNVVVDLPDKMKDLMKGDTGIKDVTKVVNSISSQLTTLAGAEGYDFSQLMSKAISEAPSVKDLRKKSDALITGVDIVQKTIEAKLGQSDEPIVAVSYTSGSVIVRVVVVNPSDKKDQEVPVKVYLPQETKPDDVMDKGDLEFGYDEVKAVYFVYKDKIMLQPKETRIFEVELKDIWFIPEETLKGLKTQTEKILKRLEGTPYLDQAKLIAGTIYGRLERVATSQADESVNKELHIGLYRANLVVIAKVKEDIAKLEKTLVAVGAAPAPEMLAESKLNLKTPSRATTWFIIFAIMVFIGLLGVVFFFTWQSQVKDSSDFPEDKNETTSSKTDENSGQPPSDAT